MCLYYGMFLNFTLFFPPRNILYTAISFDDCPSSTFRETVLLPSRTNYLLCMARGVPCAKEERKLEGCRIRVFERISSSRVYI